MIIDKSLYSWGWNEHGNLGINNKIDQCIPFKLDFPIEDLHKVNTI